MSKKTREGSASRYNREDLLKDSLAIIKKHKVCFIDDLVVHLPCCRSTFYHFELHKTDVIKQSIFSQRQFKKMKLRKGWENTENATLQMGLYKLLANDDELERLTNNKQKTEVVIKSDRNLDELNSRIAKMENEANEQEYDIKQD
jgi:hypothetical protein